MFFNVFCFTCTLGAFFIIFGVHRDLKHYILAQKDHQQVFFDYNFKNDFPMLRIRLQCKKKSMHSLMLCDTRLYVPPRWHLAAVYDISLLCFVSKGFCCGIRKKIYRIGGNEMQ